MTDFQGFGFEVDGTDTRMTHNARERSGGSSWQHRLMGAVDGFSGFWVRG